MKPYLQVLKTFDNIFETSGKLAKGKWIANLTNSPEIEAVAREMQRYCYDPSITFGIIMPACNDRGNAGDLDMSDKDEWGLFKFALENSIGTSVDTAKRQKFAELFSQFSPRVRFWFTRIINRDMGCGVTTGWEKQLPNLFFRFEVGLAKKLEDQHWTEEEYAVENKLDGYRCVAIKRDGKTKVYSREGKPLYNLDHIIAEIDDCVEDNFILDGEAVGRDFSETQSILSKESAHPDARTVNYVTFDTMAVTEWDAKHCPFTWLIRRANLERFLDGKMFKYIDITEYKIAKGDKELRKICLDYAKNKWEGGVGKEINSLYCWDKRRWIKLKPVMTEDLLIVGANPGEEGGKYRHTLGSLQVEGDVVYRGKTVHVVGNASGMDDAKRDELWAMHLAGTLVGKVGEFEFQEPTKNKKTGIYSIRFCQFQHLRFDKTV